MKGKLHPFQIVLSLLLILSGMLLVSFSATRLEQVFRDFSFIILNFVLFFGLMGLVFISLGLLRLRTISISEDTISEYYFLGLYKRELTIQKADKFFVKSRNYGFIKQQILLFENAKKQQIGLSNWKFLNFNALAEKISYFSLVEEKLTMRSSLSDKIVNIFLFALFIWLMISTIFNLTF